MLLELVGALGGPNTIPPCGASTPNGKWSFSQLCRPSGSLVHYFTSAVTALRGELKRGGDDTVKMITGGAPCSWEAEIFFNWLVFGGNFSNHYAATEASPIAAGHGWAMEPETANLRLAPRPTDPTGAAEWEKNCEDAIAWSRSRGGQEGGGRSCGELEVRGSAAAARRYFGAEYNEQAAAQSREAFTPDGWWRSEDLVEYFSPEVGTVKRLRVLGRRGDKLEMYFGGGSVFFGAGDLTALLSACAAVHENLHLALDCKRDEGEGEGKRSSLVAVLVPAGAWLEEWARKDPLTLPTSSSRASLAELYSRDAAFAHRLNDALVRALGETARAKELHPCWAPGVWWWSLSPGRAPVGSFLQLTSLLPVKWSRRGTGPALTWSALASWVSRVPLGAAVQQQLPLRLQWMRAALPLPWSTGRDCAQGWV